MIDSRIRFIGFFPGCSPCFKGTFIATFFHPAYSLILTYSCLSFASFSMLSFLRWSFSSSFCSKNSSSCFLASSFRLFFYSYSRFYIYVFIYSLFSQLSLNFLLFFSHPDDLFILLRRRDAEGLIHCLVCWFWLWIWIGSCCTLELELIILLIDGILLSKFIKGHWHWLAWNCRCCPLFSKKIFVHFWVFVVYIYFINSLKVVTY